MIEDEVKKDFESDKNGEELELLKKRNSFVENNNAKNAKTCEEFEEILELIGDEGKYQKILLYGIICPTVVIMPFFILNTVFLWDIPDHWCHVDGFEESNMTLDQWKNYTVPWEKGPDGLPRHSQCQMYDLGEPVYAEDGVGIEYPVKNCDKWDYDKSDYENTLPSAHDWVCDKAHYPTDCFTWTNMGYAVGSILFGILADKYGRRPAFFISLFCNAFFKTISLLVPQYYFLYKVLQLLGSLVYPTVFTMPALICAEISSPEYRSWIYAATWIIWVAGNAVLPFIAMVCRTWQVFGWVTAIPGLLLFVYLPFLDESPRWLVTVGKTGQAVGLCNKIAKKNGKKVDSAKIEKMVEELSRKQKEDSKLNKGSSSVWSLFSKFNLAKNTTMLIIAWTMNMLLYYGVVLNITKMAGNKFINYFVLSVIEIPAGWIAGKMVEQTGRRWTQVGFFGMCVIGCGVCAVSVMFPNSALIVLIAALVVKFGVTISSMVVYLQGAEIFPTLLRSTGSGLASTISSCFGTIGPYIVYTGTMHVAMPWILMCVISAIGTLSASWLPETLHQTLPETVEDADNFGKDHTFFSYLPKSESNESKKENKVIQNGEK